MIAPGVTVEFQSAPSTFEEGDCDILNRMLYLFLPRADRERR